MEIGEVFKQTTADKEKALKHRMFELRMFQTQLSGVSLRWIMKYGIEWQEITGRLLEQGNRPGASEKFEDAERRRRELAEFEKRGTMKK